MLVKNLVVFPRYLINKSSRGKEKNVNFTFKEFKPYLLCVLLNIFYFLHFKFKFIINIFLI